MIQFWLAHTLLGCSDKGSDSANVDESAQWSIIEQNDPRGAWLRVMHPVDSPEETWIVGGQPDQGVVLRGTNETLQPLPLPDGIPLLNWIDGTTDNMWVGGLSGTILHWDGTNWTDHSLDIEEAIWGIEVTENTVIAVGGSSRWGGERGIIWQYTDETWSSSSTPPEIEDIGNFFKVVDDGQQFWIVGTQGIVLKGTLDNWELMPTGITKDLITVIDTNNGVEIVGGRGTGIHILGTNDELIFQDPLIAGINGIAYHDGTSLLVGEMGYSLFSNHQTQIIEEIPAVTTHILHAASVQTINGSQTWFAVGGNLATSDSSYQGSILKMEWSP